MTKLLMFEVYVKNMMEGRREGKKGRGPARVWGSDNSERWHMICQAFINKVNVAEKQLRQF